MKSVPVFVTRNEIKNQVNSIEACAGHIEQISFSEPLKMYNFERFAWVTFDSDESYQAALAELENRTVRVPDSFSYSTFKDYQMVPIKNN